MTRILFIYIILIVGFYTSCTKNSNNGGCNTSTTCDKIKYDSGWVDVKVTANPYGVPLVLYKGYADDHNIISMDTAYDDIFYYYLPVNERYAVEAYYYDATQTTVATDGDKLAEDYFYNCNDKCYNQPEITLNVKKL